MCRGYTDVVDADLSKYFETIPHADLLKSVARRIVDRNVLWLIELWLRVPVEERDGNGTRRMSGGKSNKRGTPQGGVASPLLSVIYMNRVDRLSSQPFFLLQGPLPPNPNRIHSYRIPVAFLVTRAPYFRPFLGCNQPVWLWYAIRSRKFIRARYYR